MKIMIIGGKTEQNESWEKIKEACIEIGKILRQKKSYIRTLQSI